MYGSSRYIGIKEAGKLIGVGRNTVLRLCQEHVGNFPAVRVGNRWQVDAVLLAEWKARWYNREFEI